MGLLGWLRAFWQREAASDPSLQKVQRSPIPPAPADMLGAATLVKEKVPDLSQESLPHVVIAVEPPARFARCVAEVFKHEGGYVNHPDDPGGPTNFGITQATLSDWRDEPASEDDVKNLTELEAREIYRALYWNAVHGDNLPAGVDLAVFDFAVNSGVGRAVRALQRQLGVTADGAIGPVTLAAVRRVNAARLAGDLCRARLAWLQKLKTWPVFGKGWTARVIDVERAALSMAGR